ncbi:MAG: hypothetical protein AAFU71_07090 [Cyanobacteria bacterium J06632_22]
MPKKLNPIAGDEKATFLPPDNAAVNPAGFAAAAILQSRHSMTVKREMAAVAAQLVDDPAAMRLFCDRVYQLLHDDLRTHQERTHSYGRR